uniref:Tyrosine-protein kinase n=1 Tax=Parastrongyloides trichosuri TaxID=131310 RepID=A0A0N4ZSK4_PARTI
MVPSNSNEMLMSTSTRLQMPWLHGKISREKTEKILANTSDGTFLIRESTNYPGDYTLCLSYNKKVEHYRIHLLENNHYTCDHEAIFPNLVQLVAHYKRDADGLCHELVSPVISDDMKAHLENSNIDTKITEFRKAGILVNRKDLVIGDVIGKGEFGDVYCGIYLGQKVAVKSLKNGITSDLLAEAKFMSQLNNIHLVALIGVVMDDTREVNILTEFMANGNLVDYLRSRGRYQVDKRQLISIALNVAEGMRYMESQRLVHRDLAARNILLDENYCAKISDFGLAQSMDKPTTDCASKVFPVKWTSVEALRHGKFSNKSDVWSFGILLWEIFSFGRVPYPRIPIQDVVRHIEQGYRMENPEGCPQSINALMAETWNLDPACRPTFAQICVQLRRNLQNYIS